MSFIHLHAHSEFSPDGLGRIEDLVEYVASLGQTHFALTDHGTMANVVAFYLACKEYGVTPIFGNEAYLHAFDEEVNKPKITHITLLARNQVGFDNLIRLNNASHINTVTRRTGPTPLTTYDMLDEYSEGLIVLTGCVASAIHLGDYNFGYTYVERLTKLVGRENVYGELMFTMRGQDFHSRVIGICNDLRLPTVITNDCHFIQRAHADIHPYLVQARKGYNYESSTLYVMSEEEIKRESLHYISKTVFENSVKTINKIVETIEPINLDSEPQLPVTKDAKNILFKILTDKLKEDLENNPNTKEERQERFDKEVSVIDGKGYWDYFYILNDIIYFCQQNNIRVNVRGSAGGCYILYLLDITPVDPVRYNLLFERFLNTAREDYPDVDVDVEILKRSDVLDYAKEKWGMIGVANYATFGHKSLVHDLCRVFALPKDLELAAADGDETTLAFQKLCEQEPLFEQAYNVMLNQTRHRGKHAGAIASVHVRELPIELWNSDQPLIAFTEGAATKQLSKIGVVKYDILGVKKLDQLSLMAKLTGVTPPKHPDDYPQEIFDTLCEGKLTGIFQLGSSPGIRDLTLRFQPKTFEDLGMISSLYRPGALDNFSIDEIIEYKVNPRKIHPEIDKLLADSYSIMVYQENIMDVYSLVTQGKLEDADLARRFLSPKTPKVLEDPKYLKQRDEMKEHFVTEGLNQGYPNYVLQGLWAELEKFARYGFNKSHAYSYAYLALQDAWYRTYYPYEYYLSLLELDLHDNVSNAQSYIFDAVQEGLNIRMPHINTSGASYTLKNDTIYLPLSAIKGIGETSLLNLLEIRESVGTFTDFKQMNDIIPGRTLNKTLRAKLYNIGSFDGIDGDPEDFGIDLEKSENYTQHEIVGFLVPPAKVIKEINKWNRELNTEIGIVTQIVKKKTKRGDPMVRIHLAPSGGFWFLADKFVNEEIEKGMFLRCHTTDYNMAQDIIKYKVK